MQTPLTDAAIEGILGRLPHVHVGVVGDLFLDRYLDLDDSLTETSIETGLPAFQVTRTRASPGAAGTVLNNLVALGVGRVSILSVIGDDGEGFELRRELERRQIDLRFLLTSPECVTPTYVKPMVHAASSAARELSRLDLKNRSPLPLQLQEQVLCRLALLQDEAHALVVCDQVREPECGVITQSVRERLAELGESHPDKLLLADSRSRIGLFRNVWLKPNQTECRAAVPEALAQCAELSDCVRELAARAGRPVLCTRGERGILAFEPRTGQFVEAPGFPVQAPIDPVGAGDSVNAGVACAIAAGASLAHAAAFGNLVASITIQQLGTTGTASPAQVWERWRQIKSSLDNR